MYGLILLSNKAPFIGKNILKKANDIEEQYKIFIWV
jgi:hypothetical protein